MTNEEKEEFVKLLSFYREVWEERPHYSEVSGKWLGDIPRLAYFEHLIPKSSHPQYKYEKRNIALVTAQEHHVKENGFPLPKHKELIEKAKKELICGEKTLIKS